MNILITNLITMLSMLLLIGAVLILSKISRKFRKEKQIKNEAIDKIGILIVKIEKIQIVPVTGKVEYIDFYLNNSVEHIFYSIPPKYFKRLRYRLEKDISFLKQNEFSYGHQYAERRFYIGDKLIFQWHNEVKI